MAFDSLHWRSSKEVGVRNHFYPTDPELTSKCPHLECLQTFHCGYLERYIFPIPYRRERTKRKIRLTSDVLDVHVLITKLRDNSLRDLNVFLWNQCVYYIDSWEACRGLTNQNHAHCCRALSNGSVLSVPHLNIENNKTRVYKHEAPHF